MGHLFLWMALGVDHQKPCHRLQDFGQNLPRPICDYRHMRRNVLRDNKSQALTLLSKKTGLIQQRSFFYHRYYLPKRLALLEYSPSANCKSLDVKSGQYFLLK